MQQGAQVARYMDVREDWPVLHGPLHHGVPSGGGAGTVPNVQRESVDAEAKQQVKGAAMKTVTLCVFHEDGCHGLSIDIGSQGFTVNQPHAGGAEHSFWLAKMLGTALKQCGARVEVLPSVREGRFK